MSTSRLRTITTVRHSATSANAAQIISGRLDEPLSDEGRRLARDARARLGPLAADLVVASPMQRTVETAALITAVPVGQIVLDPLCVERDYGALQGLTSEEVRAYDDRVDYIEVGGIAHSLNPPGGESFEVVRERAEQFYASLRGRGIASVIVVSHQTFLQQFHGLLLGVDVIPSLGFDIRTLQVDRFTIDGELPASLETIDPGQRRFHSW